MKRGMQRIVKAGRLLLLAAVGIAQAAAAQEPPNRSGYSGERDFGGPESVSHKLSRGDELRDSLYEWAIFDGYFDWKRQIRDDYDVSFGLLCYVLAEQASDSLPGREDDAFGNIFRFPGSWTTGRSGSTPVHHRFMV
jgi:hypothetical protein